MARATCAHSAMEHEVLQVETRTPGKKGVARKLRADGRVPGVLYGHKEAPVHLSVDPRAMSKSIRSTGKGTNTLFKVAGLDREVLALVKDAQIHPVKRNLLHVDLIEVRDGDRLVVEVPLEFKGKPAGVVLGGALEIARRSVKLDVSPLAVPTSVTVNLEPLQIGDNLHVSDLTLPEGTSAPDPRLAVCAVKAPKREETTETAEGEEGEEGAAPAAESATAADS
ncbi:MAG: 50S ribosomal protein L25 [Deltaproteobacteria bacterium]